MSGQKRFNESIRREVVHRVQSGELTQEAASIEYGIKGHSTILKWIRKFEDNKLQSRGFMDYRNLEKEELINRIRDLESKLKDEEIRSVGYSKMIDIAEEQLNISIRKKPDTKQSKK